MRTIKFRGLKTNRKEWVYGSFIQNNIDCPCIIDIYAEQYEVIPQTVGQFTGLFDIEGTEIYEGDHILPFSLQTKSNKSVIVYEFNSFRIKGESLYWNFDLEQIKIIGNIHEN